MCLLYDNYNRQMINVSLVLNAVNSCVFREILSIKLNKVNETFPSFGCDVAQMQFRDYERSNLETRVAYTLATLITRFVRLFPVNQPVCEAIVTCSISK